MADGGGRSGMARQADEGHRWRAGLGPGLAAGAAMALVLVILSLGRSEGAFVHFELLAALLRRPSERPVGIGAVVGGHLLHFGLSAGAGILFTRLFGRTTRVRALGEGLLWGAALWGATELFFLPVLNPAMAMRPGMLWPWLLGYLTYGAMLGATVPVTFEIDELHGRFTRSTP